MKLFTIAANFLYKNLVGSQSFESSHRERCSLATLTRLQNSASVFPLATGDQDELGIRHLLDGAISHPYNQATQALCRSKNMNGEKEGNSFTILRIYDEPEERKYKSEDSDIPAQHGPEAQSPLDGVCDIPQWPPVSPARQGPVYQEMSSLTPQQWALQALDRSELQASWFSAGAPREDAEFGSR